MCIQWHWCVVVSIAYDSDYFLLLYMGYRSHHTHFSNTTPLVFWNKKCAMFKSSLSVSVLVIIDRKIIAMCTFLRSFGRC